MTTPRRICLAVIAFVALNACSSDDDSTDATSETSTAATESTDPEDTTDAGVDTDPDGTDAADTTAEPPPATVPAELCEQFQAIADLEAQSNELLVTAADFAELRDLFLDSLPEVDEAYRRIEELAPREIADDAELLREFTNAAAEVAEEVDSVAEFQPAVLSLPNALEAGPAALRINAYSEENCGITTSAGAG
jgi:hypothetical protein